MFVSAKNNLEEQEQILPTVYFIDIDIAMYSFSIHVKLVHTQALFMVAPSPWDSCSSKKPCQDDPFE